MELKKLTYKCWHNKVLIKVLTGCLVAVLLSVDLQEGRADVKENNEKRAFRVTNKSKRVLPAKLMMQQGVKGVVVDSEGVTLPGASIMIKGTNVGTQTDKNGAFSFPSLDEGAVLTVSFTGFLPQDIPVKGRSQLKVVLVEDPAELAEVVVVAFGTQKKTDMVGAVTTIKPSDLRAPSSNLTTALAGQAAGIIAYQRSGEPGQDNADFFIRGVTTFGTGKVDPLILIDGMELSVTELARLRPDDI